MKLTRILPCALPFLLLLFVYLFQGGEPSSEAGSGPSQRLLKEQTVRASKALFSKAPQAFHDWAQTYQADPGQVDLNRGLALAKERRAVLKKLIEIDPERALDLAIWPEDRVGIPPEIEDLLELPISTAAEFERVISCYTGDQLRPEGAPAEERYVSFDGERFRAFTYGRRIGLQTKDRISLFGIALDGDLAFAPEPVRKISDNGLTVEAFGEEKRFASEDELDGYVAMLVEDENAPGPGGQADLAESAWTEGSKRILYLRVRFADDDPSYEPVTLATAQSHQDDVAEHYRIASYGKLNVTTVFPDMINLSQNKSAYVNQGLGLMMNEARDLAIAMGDAVGEDWNYANYDLYTIVSDRGIGSYAGVAQVGGRKSHHQRGYTSLRTSAHEFGHNLGLLHAHFNYTSDLSPRGETPTNGLGEVEYGHRFSVMSAQFGGDFDNPALPHFTVHEKWRLDWLTDADMVDVTQGSQSGTYRLYQNDREEATGTRALRIPSGGRLPKYWLSYRTAWRQPNRNTNNEFLSNGVLFNWTNPSNRSSTLLDMTPYSDQGSSGGSTWTRDNSDKWDAPLLIGRTYTDPESKVSVTPMARGGSAPNEYLDVYVHLNVGSELTLVDENAPCRVLIPDAATPSQAAWTSAGFDDTSWPLSGNLGVGYDTRPDYEPYFGVDVIAMRSNNESCYIRVPFQIDGGVDLADFETLQLQMRYDDGFVAYLNGVKFAEANAPGTPTWNSGATADHSDGSALVFQNFDASAALGALVNGTNILAIHGMNEGSTSSDLLMQPRLIATASSSANSSPEVSLSASTLTVGVNQDVTLTASGTDSDGDELAYAWDFDIGGTFAPEGLNNPVAVRRWNSQGVYVVTVTCSDRKGGIARERVVVRVGDPGNDGVVRGRVLQGGEPVAGARVFIEGSDRQCLTLEDGSYVMSGLSKSLGTTLGAMFDGDVFQSTVAMPVVPDPELSGVDFLAHGSPGPGSPSQVMTLSPVSTNTDVGVEVQLDARIWDNTLSEDLLIPLGDAWRYLDTGVDPGGSWITAGFDDSGWLSGAAELGYGDGQTTTVSFGSNTSDRHITTWFRRTFTSSNVSEISRLKLSVKRDDGVRVFLNGTEIARDNLTTGTVSAGTKASNDVSSSVEEVLLIFNVDPALLQEGENILAAEVHQEDDDSNDLSFDLELSAARNLSEASATWSVVPAGGSVSPEGIFTATNSGAYTVTATSGALSAQVEILVSSDVEVNIVALDNLVWENGGASARFEVSRTGSVIDPLLVPLVFGGDAVAGVDYSGSLPSVFLPVGSSSETFDIVLIDDSLEEGNEVLSVSLDVGGLFASGSPLAMVTILDDENAVVGQPEAGNTLTVDQNESLILGGSFVGVERFLVPGDYWKWNDSGFAAPSSWSQSSFDDSAWQAGLAKFGYGDNDEATEIDFGGVSGNKHITTYFRSRFYLDDPADYSALTARVLVDDGAVIYLNGIEVERINMPTGTITFSTRANGAVGGGDEETFFEWNLDRSALVAGENVIAVEVHQSSPSSSDLGFDLALGGTLVNPVGPGAVLWSQQAGPGTASFVDAGDPASAVSFDQAGTYRLRLEDYASGQFDEVVIVVEEARNYQNWVADYPVADSTPLGDSDGDGVANLLEYGLGGDPTATGDVTLPAVTKDPAAPDDLMFTYRRLREANSGDSSGETGNGYLIDGISYTVQVSDLVAGWSPAAGAMAMQVEGAPVDNGDGTETVQLRLTPPVGENVRWFVRLQISEQ